MRQLLAMTLVSSKQIKRVAVNDRYLTAIEISKEGWSTAQTLVLARDDLFPDALAGASLYSPTSDEIKRLGAKKAYILGGEGVVSSIVK